MSSIEQRENPYSRSPIPRSRSDFSYVGLTPKDKRWSADLSNLLPNFNNRDSSGYLRLLEEAPVTNQPKPVKSHRVRSPTSENSSCSNRNYSMEANILNNTSSLECNATNHSPLVDLSSLSRNSNGQQQRYCVINRSPNLNHIRRSPTLEPSPLVRSPLTNVINRSPTLDSDSLGRGQPNANVISRSPTLDPNVLRRSPLTAANVVRCPALMDSNLARTQRSPAKASDVISRSPTLDGVGRSPKASDVIIRSSTLDGIGRSPVKASDVIIRSPTLEGIGRSSPSKINGVIARSPTLDPKIFRHSNNNNSLKADQSGFRRSPTLDSTVISRSPVRSYAKGHSRSPILDVVGHNPTPSRNALQLHSSPAEVVRSQSLKSLRKEKSPVKIRSSESAHCDVTNPRPTTLVEEDEDDVRRLRNFSVTPKGVVNWGDSFRSHSLTSVPCPDNMSGSSSQWDVSSNKSYPMAASSSLGFAPWHGSKTATRYRVAIMGADEVGKTSLIRQFQTSEYICAFDNNYDVSSDCAITVILNEEESELEFLDHRFVDEDIEDKDSNQNSGIPLADAHVIVYSVTNRRSFLRALDALTKVQAAFLKSAALLVGNKSDLVRVRAVTTDEGQTAAKEKDCPFIETSVAINHQVDELLVAILSQIRTRSKAENRGVLATRWGGPHCTLSKAKGILKKFLKKACFQSKSCDNLQRL